MKGDRLSGYGFVVRHCRATDLTYGPDGRPNGINEAAFRPKPADIDGISVIWLDFFGSQNPLIDPRPYQLNCARSVVSLNVTNSQRLAILLIGDVNAAIFSGGGNPSVVHDPSDDLPPGSNAAHALIGPIDILNDVVVREALASAVGPSEVVPYQLTP
jgi:hypothetical protein